MRALKPDPTKDPTLTLEQELCATGEFSAVIGVDEAGRGAIAGPVAVGVHTVIAGTNEFPSNLRDSKLLSEARREALFPMIEQWGPGAVGYASAREIDEQGITAMLALAARRALLELHESGVDVNRALILLDGNHDWLSPALRRPLRVVVKTGADRAHASVAAASLRAKVSRDRLMQVSHDEHPAYEWHRNKGYGSAAHYTAIREHGLTPLHRATWIT